MLNYAETASSCTFVPLVPCQEERQTESPPSASLAPALAPTHERQQGREAGRIEFKQMLEQAEQHKGEAFTKREIREVYSTRFLGRMQEWERGNLATDWFEGWCRGFVPAYIQAEETAPTEQVVTDIPPHESSALTPVRFRQALIEVDDPEAFLEGVMCGQARAVEETERGTKPLTGTGLFALVVNTTALDEEASETWAAGYILGLADAICRTRQYYPRGW